MAIIIIILFLILSSSIACPEDEKQALLIFKNDLFDPTNRLASWDPHHHHLQDCCRWFGVICDNRTGHVISLNLGLTPPRDDDTDDSESYRRSRLEGTINPCLSNLKQLRYLDLSNNMFEGLPPYQLGRLSNLEYLNLGGNSGLYVENLEWWSGLSSLKHLDLSSADLSGASDWLRVVNRELPSLEELHLSDCQLPPVPSLLNVNLSSLAVLDLSDNYFTNQMDLGWLSKLNSLVFLHLGGNYFDGSIPDFLRNMSSSLRHLDLSSNDFNSSIPDWLYSFSALRVMRLGDNQLKGDISSAIGNMTSLDEFNLFGNELEGKLTRPVGKLCKLRSIDLSYMILRQDISHILEILSGCSSTRLESLKFDSCLLSGQLTDQLEHFKNLKQLSLSDNSISGSIPTYLGKLANLERVYISNNLLQGVVSEKHFSNHTKLRRFDGSGNSLDLRVDPNWLPTFQLRHLYLGSWRIGPSFPSWLRSQKHLQYLDISNSSISDTIPSWFWRLSTQFSFLNLSTNHFSGPLPRISTGSTNVIDLSNNYFSAPLSHFLCNQLNRATITLILSNNLLSGEIPDCWIKYPSLIVLRLDGNRFTGGIPTSMGSLTSLRSLHLHNNRLHGEILPLKNCTNLVAIDLGNNELSGNIPGWLGYGLPNLLILILRSNKFRGNIPDHICALSFGRYRQQSLWENTKMYKQLHRHGHKGGFHGK